MKRTLRITNHAKQRIGERSRLGMSEIKSMFGQAIPQFIMSENGCEHFRFKNYEFIAKRHLGKTYHLVTFIKHG